MQGVEYRIPGFKKIETNTSTLRCFRCFELLDFVLSQYKLFFKHDFSPRAMHSSAHFLGLSCPEMISHFSHAGVHTPSKCRQTRSLVKPGEANSQCMVCLLWDLLGVRDMCESAAESTEHGFTTN